MPGENGFSSDQKSESHLGRLRGFGSVPQTLLKRTPPGRRLLGGAPLGRWVPARAEGCPRFRALGDNPASSPLLPAEGPRRHLPHPRPDPREERVAPTVEQSGRRQMPGPRSAPGRGEAKPVRVGDVGPGLGAAVARAAQLPPLGKTSRARILWGGLSEPSASDHRPGRSLSTCSLRSPDHRDAVRERAREGSQGKENSREHASRLSSPFLQMLPDLCCSTPREQERPNFPALLGDSP